MSYKLHILIDHEATSLTEQEDKDFEKKSIDLADKISNIMLGNINSEDLKRSHIMEEIQTNFSPAEILLLAIYGLEMKVKEFVVMKSNPLEMLTALFASAYSDKKE